LKKSQKTSFATGITWWSSVLVVVQVVSPLAGATYIVRFLPRILMATAPTPSAEDQAKFLEDALGVVKIQSFQMKRCLVRSQLPRVTHRVATRNTQSE
jgi:hypothetical protein